MNIKRAKEEIQNSIRAYLAKDAYGDYLIPAIRQRPVLLMGPPGIGKTQIMEQIARECGVALVAYTITHHTRQSAVGLPFIREKEYGGKAYSVTEYTMSEIIASVYNKMEETGLREGILFIDEINCVSETLAPTMLQFLQCKTFGNQKVPEGWIIVAAGNPPEYNKSVREFDIVTLDRVKRIDVEEDFQVWKEYAYRQSVHGAVISYLDIKPENFYRIQATVDGASFATARGWEDLSQLLQAYEKLELPVDAQVVGQYIQHPKTAKDFANYLELYYKYQSDYHVEEILGGHFAKTAISELRAAPFDERLSVLGLLLSILGESFKSVYFTDLFVTELHGRLKALKEALAGGDSPENALWAQVEQASQALEQRRAAGQLDKAGERGMREVLRELERYRSELREQDLKEPEPAFEWVKGQFQRQVQRRKVEIDEASARLDNAFRFLEETFGDSQELVVFVTELTVGYYSTRFISENGCERYYRHNKGLLFGETHRELLREIDEVRDLI